MMPKKFLLLFSLTLLLFSSCKTSYVDLTPVDDRLKSGNIEGALVTYKTLSGSVTAAQGDIVHSLDLGLLSHFNKNYDESNKQLTKAEKLIDKAYTKSISKSLGSYVFNDNIKEYPGEDYEDIYLNVFKSLNYAQLGKTESAMVEIRRSSEKQKFLQSKYNILIEKEKDKTRVNTQFTQSALSSYLGMLYSNAGNNPSDTAYFKNATKTSFETQKGLYSFPFPESAVNRSEIEKGKTRLEFVAFTGLCPIKYEYVDQVMFSSDNFVKLALPKMQERPSVITKVTARLSNGQMIELERIEDISKIALDTFTLRESAIYSKTMARVIGKGSAAIASDTVSYLLRNDDSTENDSASIWADVFSLFIRVFNQTSENADLRMGHYFPSTAWVGYTDVEPGNYTITYIFNNNYGTIFKSDNILIDADDSKLNISEGFCPL